MAKLDGNKRISRDDMPNSQDWIDPFLTNQNQVNDSVVNAIRGTLTHQENTTSGYFTGKFQHGVERIIRNPLIKSGTTGPSPTGVVSVNCQKLYTDATSLTAPVVASVSLRYINGNDPKAPEQVGITVQYDLAHTRPFARLGKTAVQAIGNAGAGTAVQWDSNTISADGIISIASNSRIMVSEAGLYLFTGNLEYVTNAAGIRNQLFAYNGATTFTQPDGTRGYVQAMNTGAVFGVAVAGSALFVMAASSYVEMFGYQNSGGALNITTFSQLQVARLRNDTAPTANVTLFFHGG